MDVNQFASYSENITLPAPGDAPHRPAFPVKGHRIAKRRWAVYKRTFDIIFALFALLLLAVPLIWIALWIKLDSRGPVFFVQPRRGKDNRPFSCIKFRTMRLECADIEAKQQSREDDPRVTKAGEFLRQHSLDELPQFLNVLAGSMSVVGPRPHALGTAIEGRLLPEIADDYLMRYAVKPGITGWAQVNGYRGILDSQEKLHARIAHDLYYILYWSPIFDIRVVLRTLPCLVERKSH